MDDGVDWGRLRREHERAVGSGPRRAGERKRRLHVRGSKPPLKDSTTVIIDTSTPEEPIRAEIFGAERLEQHGESLALAQRITASPGRGRGSP